ncbi:uncharacterized protein LOC144792000 [Lissotriton helveticus]
MGDNGSAAGGSTKEWEGKSSRQVTAIAKETQESNLEHRSGMDFGQGKHTRENMQDEGVSSPKDTATWSMGAGPYLADPPIDLSDMDLSLLDSLLTIAIKVILIDLKAGNNISYRISLNIFIMAVYEEEDSYYYDEEPEDSFEYNLVDALDQGVQHSVNSALVRAIGPLKRHLMDYAQQQGWIPSSASAKLSSKSPRNPHKLDFVKLAKSLSSSSGSKKVKPSTPDTDDSSSSSSSSGPSAPPAKKSRKEHFVDASAHPPVLTFEPTDIVHPNSKSWLPAPEVAEYVQAHIRESFDQEVRSRLRSECPRPDLADKLAETPEVDPTILTYLRKFTKDPKKGIDRSWRLCQDKLLDLLGPLTKILDLGYQAQGSASGIDPDELIGWAQRAMCQLGNANCALSTERRRSILLKIDPRLTELASSESGPFAQGLLFGQPFLKELTKLVSTFSGLDKAQSLLRRGFRPVFGRAGRSKGRLFGRGSGQQRGNQSQQGGGQQSSYSGSKTNFYPSRKGRGQPSKGGYGGQQGGRQDFANTEVEIDSSTDRFDFSPEENQTGYIPHYRLYSFATSK